MEYDYEDEPSSPHIIYVNTDRLQKIDIDDKTLSYLVESVWEPYKEIQESVESESKDNQEENSNV